MGGASAKLRRKQQRLHLQQPFHDTIAVPQANPPSSPKSKKFQKPKHLKRKLESSGIEETEKQRLLRELREFERFKSKTTATGSSGAKKPKTSAPMKEKDKTNYNYNNESNKKSQQDNTPTGAIERTTQPEETNFVRNTVKRTAFSNNTKGGKEPVPQKEKQQQQEEKQQDAVEVEGQAPALQDDDDDDASDNENDVEVKFNNDTSKEGADNPARTRGRRRKGRQSTSQKVHEQQHEDKTKEQQQQDNNNDNKSRYCLGRKPVSDFVVGQTYQGTVVYAKPFGVFFDIGCHSDAFCHVSRLRDDYVDSPEVEFPPGLTVNQVRVVEIDRQGKRITVSLQSEARMADEQLSLQARAARQEKISQKKGSKKKGRKHEVTTTTTTNTQGNKDGGENRQLDHLSEQKQNKSETAAAPNVFVEENNKAESEMTPAEFKRHRKLQRRASRRAERDVA